MFVELAKSPLRSERFAKSMSLISTSPGMDPASLIVGYPWEQVETLIDLGGSHNATSIALVRHFPNIRCVVQDLPDTLRGAIIPEDLNGRVKFIAHDFFTPQPESVDAYFLRWILHDWSDKYCVMILQNLIPAMKLGARILINEFVIPEPGGIPYHKERYLR